MKNQLRWVMFLCIGYVVFFILSILYKYFNTDSGLRESGSVILVAIIAYVLWNWLGFKEKKVDPKTDLNTNCHPNINCRFSKDKYSINTVLDTDIYGCHYTIDNENSDYKIVLTVAEIGGTSYEVITKKKS